MEPKAAAMRPKLKEEEVVGIDFMAISWIEGPALASPGGLNNKIEGCGRVQHPAHQGQTTAGANRMQVFQKIFARPPFACRSGKTPHNSLYSAA
jgi:hypothetical protein